MSLDQRFTFDRVVHMLLWTGSLVLVIWLLRVVTPALMPFAIALLLAYLLHPLVLRVQRWLPNRAAASLLTLGVVAAVIAVIGYGVALVIFSEVEQVRVLIGRLDPGSGNLAARAREWIPEPLLDQLYRQLSDAGGVEGMVREIDPATVARRLGPLADAALGTVGGLLSLMMSAMLVLLCLVFLLIDYAWFRDHWQRIVPAPYRGTALRVLGEFDSAMNRHFRAQAVVALIVGVGLALGFSLIGVPLGVLMGLALGALNMVPYLQLIGIPPVLLLAVLGALQNETSVGWAIGLTLGVILLMQILQDAVLVPRIMGKAFGLRPIIILLAIMVWGQLLGLLGLIIAIPISCLIWAWYQEVLTRIGLGEVKPVVAESQEDEG